MIIHTIAACSGRCRGFPIIRPSGRVGAGKRMKKTYAPLAHPRPTTAQG